MKKSLFLFLVCSLAFSCRLENDLAFNENVVFPKNEKIYFLDNDGKTVLDSLKIEFKYSNGTFQNSSYLNSENKIILPIKNLYH